MLLHFNEGPDKDRIKAEVFLKAQFCLIAICKLRWTWELKFLEFENKFNRTRVSMKT